MLTKNIEKQSKKIKKCPTHVGGTIVPNKTKFKQTGITLIALAISRKCVRYEERAWKPCERREKERKV